MVTFEIEGDKVVEVPEELVEAVKEERTTRSGKKQVRYALQAEHHGRTLVKFVDEATYASFIQVHEDSERSVPLEEEQAQAKLIEPPKIEPPPLPEGTPAYKLFELAGLLSDEEADTMLKAIEEGC